MKPLLLSVISLYLAVFCLESVAQKTTISGKVTDAGSGDGIPFANVYFKVPSGKTPEGTVTDFEGNYRLTSENPPSDTIQVTSVGYQPKIKAIERGKIQTINFQLAEGIELQEVVITKNKPENPAWAILRKVMENKNRNNKNNLDFYEYENYTRTEVSIDNITEKFQQKKPMQKIMHLLDAAKIAAGEDGKPTIPIYISERHADVFYRKFPEKKRENIKKEKVTGLMKDTNPASQLMEQAFQDFNFYNNYVRLFEKDFISPIADGWRVFYDYELIYDDIEDDDDNPRTTLMDGVPCYKIKFKPRQPQDLAFTGVMWIADSSFHYALKQIDVTVGKQANLNFIEKIVIQQQMIEVSQEKGWLPDKTRLLIDISEIKDDWAGMLIKFYSSNRNFKINQVRPFSFYDQDIVIAEDAYNSTEAYWKENRHDSLSEATQNLYAMIDTMKKVPVVRTYMEIIDIVVNGYQDLGKVDFGPYLYLFAVNNIEGFRFRPGFRTNEKFSEKWILEGYAAYGTKDNALKYQISGTSIFDRKRWGLIGASYQRDIDQVGIFSDDIVSTQLFLAFSRIGKLKNPFMHTIKQVYAESDMIEGFRGKAILRQRDFNPLYDFEYFANPVSPESQFNTPANNLPERFQNFRVTEVLGELRYSIGERYVNRGNRRFTITQSRYPVWTFRFTKGFNQFGLGDFDYKKFVLSMQHDIRLGSLGRTQYIVTAGIIPSTVPYPLLETHLGNETFFLNARGAYNLMNYVEFVSDRYVSLHVYHRFEGLFFNRIPLLQKLKWRTCAGTRMIYGTVSRQNLHLIPYTDETGKPLPTEEHFKSFDPETPYAEIYYGIENIFKLVRVDFTHRVTYLNPDISKNFGLRIGLFFRL